MTQNYPSLETAAITPTRSVCRFGFVQVPFASSNVRLRVVRSNTVSENRVSRSNFSVLIQIGTNGFLR